MRAVVVNCCSVLRDGMVFYLLFLNGFKMRMRLKAFSCCRESLPRRANSKKRVKTETSSSLVPFMLKSSKKLLKKVF